jgi:hypothetical protein
MASQLDQDIEAFEAMLPSLRKRFGSVWAVLVDRDFKGSFSEFQSAATYAVDNFADRPFLIRHTDQHAPHIPFIAITP